MSQLNLTEGPIGKTLLRYAYPVVLSSFLQALYSLTDFVIAGTFVGNTAMSAISNSGQIAHMLTQVIMGITIGGSILVGQYYGRGDQESRIHTNRTLFSMAMLCGLFAALLLLVFGRWLLILLKAPALEEAAVYLRICALGLLPVFGYNALSAMLRGVGNSKQPLYFILATALLNVILDLLFMGVFSWGVAGAAWATVIAQTISFLLALIYTLRQRALYQLNRLYIKRDKLRHMLKLGIPTSLQMTLVGVSWLTMTFLINGYGVEASAASGITARVREVAQLFTIAMSSATSTMVAQCLGAEAYERARRAVHVAMRISIGASLLIILIVELFAPQIVSLFNQDALTSALAIQNLRIEILAQLFYASFMVYNALPIGAGHTSIALLSSTLNSIVARLILAIILNHYFALPGIFWACMIAPAFSVPLGYLYERSGIWRKSLAKETGTQA